MAGPELRQSLPPLGIMGDGDCVAAWEQQKVGRTMRDMGVSTEAVDDGGRVLRFPAPGCASPGLAEGVPTCTMELGLGTTDVIATSANKVSHIKCVTGAHPFPSGPEYSKVNKTSCQEHRHKSQPDKGGRGPLEWSHFRNLGKAGGRKRPQPKRTVLETYTKKCVRMEPRVS